MQGDMEINIVFATDAGYARQTYIAMHSIIERGNCANKYIFWILCETQKEKFINCFNMDREYPDCEIHYLEVGGYFDNVPLPIAHITKPTYYRLLIPLLLHLDRCIYLDSDIIVCDDLSDLYTVPMEGYEVAGVLAAGYQQRYGKIIGIPSMDTYINAGVLLMNLDEMRKNSFTQNAISISENRYPSSDQDIINILSYGKIKLLSFSYNYQPACVGKIDLEEIFGKEDADNAEKNPKIIHYLAPQKPWEFLNIKYAEKWWEACRRTRFFEDFFIQYHKSFYYYEIITKHNFWQEKQGTSLWYDKLKCFQEIHLYGAGKYAETIINILHKKGIRLKSIFVSSMEKNPCELGGIKVECFSGSVCIDGIVLIATSPTVALQIYRELLDRDFYDFCLLDYDRILK